MNTLLLAILFILLLLKIRYTSIHISKRIYYKNLSKKLQNKELLYLLQSRKYKSAFIVYMLFIECLLSFFYLILANIINTPIFNILSGLQVLLCFYSFLSILDKDTYSINIEDHKFRRWYFLFHLIFSYVYYLMAIIYLV